MLHARTFALGTLAAGAAMAAHNLLGTLPGQEGLLIGSCLGLVALLIALGAFCVEVQERRYESALIARIRRT